MSTQVLSEKYVAAVIAHTAATEAKTPLLVNSRVVIPLNDADADTDNVFVYQAEKVQVPKATGEAWAPLSLIYWDDTAKNFTTAAAAGANTLAGIVAEDAASADTEGVIHLSPFTIA